MTTPELIWNIFSVLGPYVVIAMVVVAIVAMGFLYYHAQPGTQVKFLGVSSTKRYPTTKRKSRSDIIRELEPDELAVLHFLARRGDTRVRVRDLLASGMSQLDVDSAHSKLLTRDLVGRSSDPIFLYGLGAEITRDLAESAKRKPSWWLVPLMHFRKLRTNRAARDPGQQHGPQQT